jgi:hypothetical protein
MRATGIFLKFRFFKKPLGATNQQPKFREKDNIEECL